MSRGRIQAEAAVPSTRERTSAAMRCIALLLLASAPMAAAAQEYRLPFADRWFAAQAGDTVNVNQHMRVKPQWFGIDFAKVGEPNGRALVKTDGARIEDFYGWDAEVLAPVDGEVVAVIDGLADNPLGASDTENPAGNHVVIRAAPDQYVFIAHLQRGSTRVATGTRVTRGKLLGLCGNSGNTSFPHIHMHVQDTPTLNAGTGRNITFSRIDVELNGKSFRNVDWPLVRGLFVANE